jgi:hypothetical protein
MLKFLPVEMFPCLVNLNICIYFSYISCVTPVTRTVQLHEFCMQLIHYTFDLFMNEPFGCDVT